MTKIVIIGGGFGGLKAALDLEKQFKKDSNTQIYLVDKREYHLFSPNLFEVATSDEELVSVKQMKRSVVLPFSEILKGKQIKFVQGECLSIDSARKKVNLVGRFLDYDFLIMASGAESEYYGILGAKKYGMALKTLPDAFRIRNRIEFIFGSHSLDFTKKNLHFIVAGGGYTGLEIAGRLKSLTDFLAWKYQYPRQKIEIVVVEAASKLVEGFDDRLSFDAYNRLQELGVHIRLSSRISGVDQNFIELMSGEKIVYDALIWTTGIKATAPNCGNQLMLNRQCKIHVNEFLHAQGLENVFAFGDVANVSGSDGKPVPGSVQEAINQGKYVAWAMSYYIKNKRPPVPYKNKQLGFIVFLGGKWAILDFGNFYIKGFMAYVVGKLAHLRYYVSLVGWFKALKYIVFQSKMYSRND